MCPYSPSPSPPPSPYGGGDVMVSVPLPSRTALEPYSGRSAMQAQAVVQGRAAGQGDTPALDLYKYGGGFIY